MGSRKRSRQQVATEDGLISIKLSGSRDEPLAAKATILRSCSTCAEGLPADAQEWDLSQLRVEGEPVQRSTVVAWLNCAYSRILDSEFEKQQKDPRCTAAGLAQLLAFADAVGSTRGVLAACLRELDNLVLEAQIQLQHGEQTFTKSAQLSTNGCAYYVEPDSEVEDEQAALRVGEVSPIDNTWLFFHSTDDAEYIGSTEAQIQAFCRAVAEQVEPLMFLAHSLSLPDLQRRILAFVGACCLAIDDSKGVLHGQLEFVFTDRVMEVVLPPGADAAAKMDFVQNSLTWVCSFVEGKSLYQMLRPAMGTPKQTLEFSAFLTQDFLGAKKGEPVAVELDLLNRGTITIGEVVLPAQLLIGQAVACDEDYRLLMTVKEDEQSSEEGGE